MENEYNENAKTANGILTISQAENIAAQIMDEIEDEEYVQDIRARTAELYEMVRGVLAQETQSASSADWHNFAVEVARYKYFDLSCDIVEAGLKNYKNNTDLLADYLQYGIYCGRIEQCKKHYNTLIALPRVKYTWRGFSFCVNFMSYLWEQSDSLTEMKELEKAMKQMASDFQEQWPRDEEAYRCKAEVHRLLREDAEEINTLEMAMKKLKKTPKCALRLADIRFENGEYKKALATIKKALAHSDQPQPTINRNYAYCLAGLSRLAEIQIENTEARTKDTTKPTAEATTEAIEKVLREVFCDFNMALDNVKGKPPYEDIICAKTKELCLKYNVEIPDSCMALLDVVD